MIDANDHHPHTDPAADRTAVSIIDTNDHHPHTDP
jgi:hypothetical protein